MSKSEKTASEKVPAEQENASVYDFLYHDARRIGSFLAQFDDNGLLTGLTRGESTARGSSRGFKLGVGANVPLIGGGNLDVERAPNETGSESLERAYDPFWANALEFLDALTERGLIQREIAKAAIGQFVLVKGSLIVADIQMIQSIWQLPSVKSLIRSGAAGEVDGNRQERLAAKAKNRGKKESSQIDMVMDMLPHMPHTGQAYLIGENGAVWAPMASEALVVPLSELVLKHGAKIAGQWAMLGILDARPNEPDNQLSPIERRYLEPSGGGGSISSALASSMGPMVKDALGRPDSMYGLTPLMIFREVKS